jgi:competence protein ComEA
LSFNLSGKTWAAISLFLVLVIIAGAVVISFKLPRNRPIEIAIVTSPAASGRIFIDGAVSNPGSYAVKPGDTMDSLLQTAGGVTSGADVNKMTLHVPQTGDIETVQKVNINTADSWLLEALPGIGETLAGRIIEYRGANGPFVNINELTDVKGISLSVYEQIKSLITVGD